MFDLGGEIKGMPNCYWEYVRGRVPDFMSSSVEAPLSPDKSMTGLCRATMALSVAWRSFSEYFLMAEEESSCVYLRLRASIGR
jgi:hypothetical protein